jgi:hypothetical protein
MKIIYIGKDTECSVKICNHLSTFHQITWIADKSPAYEVECETVIDHGLWAPDCLDETSADLVVFNGGDNYSLMNKWLAAAKGKSEKFLIIRENDFTSSNGGEFALDQLLAKAYAPTGFSGIGILNVSPLYGTITVPNSLEKIIKAIVRKNKIAVPKNFHTVCDALHIDDFCCFLEKYILQMDSLEAEVVNVHSGYAFDTNSLFDKLKEYYPQLTVQQDVPYIENALAEDAVHFSDWTPKHVFLEEIDGIISCVEANIRKAYKRKQQKALSEAGKLAIFLLAFFAVEVYTSFMAVTSDLQHVDLRIAFIAIAAVAFGRRYSVAAALLCSGASVLHSLQMGYRWHVLFFNVNNWIPVAIYIFFAVVIGILAEKLEDKN